MADENERITLSVQQLAFGNSLTLTALVEILEEKGLIQQGEVLQRIKFNSNRKPTLEGSSHKFKERAPEARSVSVHSSSGNIYSRTPWLRPKHTWG